MSLVTSTITSGSTAVGTVVHAGTAFSVESGGVMSGATVDSGGYIYGDGGILSAGTSLTTNEGVIVTYGSDPYLGIVGNVDNTSTGAIVASASAGEFSEIVLDGTLSGGGVVEAIATAAHANAILALSDETVSGGTLSAAGTAQIGIDGSTLTGATLATTGGAAIGVFGGPDSGTTPISATVSGATVVKDSYIFDDGTLTFSGGTAQTGVEFYDANGDLTLSGMSFGAGDVLSATASGSLNVSNSTNTFSAATLVRASDKGEITLSGGLANAGTILAYVSGKADLTAGVIVSAGSDSVTNSKTGLIEAETVAGFGGDAQVTVLGSGTVSNAGTFEALAYASYDGRASVSVDGGTVTNTNLIEALATSNTYAWAAVSGISGVANSGIMQASATDDATADLGIYVSGGTITNSKTVEALANDISEAGLIIYDESETSASLVNSKGAEIVASANADSDLYSDLPLSHDSLDIYVGSSITNAGTITESVSDDSDADESYIGGASLTNTGTIDAAAADDSYIDNFEINITSNGTGGSIVNSGTIAETASDDSSIGKYGEGLLFGSSIVNSGSIAVTATAGSTAYLDIDAYGTGASMTNAKTIEASATGADSYVSVGIGGENLTSDTPVILNNSGGTLEAAAAGGGTAYLDIGAPVYGTSVSGGTLKTTETAGSVAFLGAFDYNASATSVSIAADSNIAADDATLTLTDVVNPVVGTLLEALYEGTLDIDSNVFNGGTIAALGTYGETGTVLINANSGSGTVGNSGTIVASASGSYEPEAYLTISAATVSNTGTMEALAANNFVYGPTYHYAYAVFDIETGSAGTVVNKGTILASAYNDKYLGAGFYISGGAVTNAGTVKVLAASTAYMYEGDYNYGDFFGSSVINTGNMVASATDYSRDYLFLLGTASTTSIPNVANSGTIDALANGYEGWAGAYLYGGGSASTVSNTGMMVASAGTYDAEAEIELLGGTVTNTKTIEGLASDESDAYDDLYGSGSASTVTNSGTLFASAGYSNAEFSLEGGAITNVKTITALAYDDSEAYAELNGSGSASTVTNSGTMLASAAIDDAEAFVQLEGGTVTNTVGATIQAFATSGSEDTDIRLEGVGPGGDYTGTVTNSGALLVSANDNSYHDNGISIDGGTITNAASGTMKAFATNYSEEWIHVVGSGGASSVIANSGTMLASASESSEAYIYLSDAGGTIVNAKTITAVATAQSDAYADFEYASSTVNSGTIVANGGPDSDAYIEFKDTTVNNTSGLISAAGNGLIYLDDATISGGTLRTSGSEAAVNVISPSEPGTIEDATIAEGTQVFARGATLTLSGSDVISSGALVQAFDGGTIVVAAGATVTDAGTLLAGDDGAGTITVSSGGGVAGNSVWVGEKGLVKVLSGGSANIAFGDNDDGTLAIADSAGAATSAAFTGDIFGFGGYGGEFPGQLIELFNVPYAANFSASYTLNVSSASDPFDDVGTLTVTSGASTFAVISNVVGDYVNATFNIVDDGGKVAISDPQSMMPAGAVSTLAATGNAASPGASTGSVALLGSYMAALFASPEGQVGTPAAAETGQSQAVLAHPHAT